MAIGDYLWPFEREFSKIPCAREAAISGMLGGPMIGAASIIWSGRLAQATPVAVYSGFTVFWLSFLACRYKEYRTRQISEQLLDVIKSGRAS